MAVNEEQEKLVAEWYAAQKQVAEIAKPLVAREMLLRRLVLATVFINPKEGTNKEDLPEGWQVKLGYTIDRKVDKARLTTVNEEMRTLGVNPDKLIRWTPELEVKEYRGLTEEQRKVFDQALQIKPGTPTLELVPPKVK